jgi:rare lipoprotein A
VIQRLLPVVGVCVATAGCAHVVPPAAPEGTEAPIAYGVPTSPDPGITRGRASYYADSLAGHKTASGEPYDPHALTAAHRSLPFGTQVEVARPDGRRVTVRINDRGPFGPSGRIIDLSRAAAEALGMIGDGVVQVTLRVVR